MHARSNHALAVAHRSNLTSPSLILANPIGALQMTVLQTAAFVSAALVGVIHLYICT